MQLTNDTHGPVGRLQSSFYDPEELADSIFDQLEFMEVASDRPVGGHRPRAGIVNAPWFRGRATNRVEVTITDWMAELMPNAKRQVHGLVRRTVPDIVFSFERDAMGEDLMVVLEAKPVWQRWISACIYPRLKGEYRDEETGETTGTYLANNLRQVRKDRDKLRSRFIGPSYRHILLALVFQRANEVNDRVIEAVGSGWSCRSRHVLDQCNRPGGIIGLTGIVFWPTDQRSTTKPNAI